MSYSQLLERLRQNLWFAPTVTFVVSATAALAMVALDYAHPDLDQRIPLLFRGGPDSGRGVLGAIAGSTITIAGVTFSITMVVLQLTSTQFSPRVLRNFMRDRGNQLVLAAFIGAFTYAIVVLGSIVGEETDIGAFVPSAAITGALLLVFVALGMFIYFIHHIATAIQVSHIAASIAHETLATIEAEYPEPFTASAQEAGDPVPDARWERCEAVGSGYLEEVDHAGAVALAAKYDVVVRLEVRPDRWVQRDAPLFSVSPQERLGDELRRRLPEVVSVGEQRSMRHDFGFGIQQLVDIGLRAISPGINDPTTATTCIDRLAEILVAVGRRDLGDGCHRDEAGALRLLMPVPEFGGLVHLAFSQLLHFAADVPSVLEHLALRLATIASAVHAERHGPLREQAELIAEAAMALPSDAERRTVLQATDGVLVVTRR